MRVWAERSFMKWAIEEHLTHDVLCKAAREAFAGQVEGDLGGYVFKKRIARTGAGKSGGYRTIIGFRKTRDDRIFFLYGFPKNARSNITARERAALSLNAKALIDATDAQIVALEQNESITKLECKP